MTNTATTADTFTCCDSPEIMVTCGIVRCVACFTDFPNHPESAPSDIVAANQWR